MVYSKIHKDSSHEAALERAIAVALETDTLSNLLDEGYHSDIGSYKYSILRDRDQNEVFISNIDAFDGDGVLTQDRGVVVSLSDGSEFHIAIKRSRDPRR